VLRQHCRLFLVDGRRRATRQTAIIHVSQGLADIARHVIDMHYEPWLLYFNGIL